MDVKFGFSAMKKTLFIILVFLPINSFAFGIAAQLEDSIVPNIDAVALWCIGIAIGTYAIKKIISFFNR